MQSKLLLSLATSTLHPALDRFSKYLINCHCGTVVRQSYTTASGQLHLCFDEEGQEDVEM